MKIHILKSKPLDQEVRVAFHLPIPDTSNSVGTNKRIAVKECYDQATSQVPFIDPTELTQIQNGEIYEHVESIVYQVVKNDAEKLQIIKDRYTELISAKGKLQELNTEIKYWGKSVDVP